MVVVVVSKFKTRVLNYCVPSEKTRAGGDAAGTEAAIERPRARRRIGFPRLEIPLSSVLRTLASSSHSGVSFLMGLIVSPRLIVTELARERPMCSKTRLNVSFSTANLGLEL
jgi:hypothetical protein